MKKDLFNQNNKFTKYDPEFKYLDHYKLSLIHRNPIGPAKAYRTLDMYITTIYLINDKHQKIKGVIKDEFGTANFSGELLNDNIDLIMKYELQSTQLNEQSEIILLTGNKKEKYYSGTYSEIKKGKLEYNDNQRFGIRQITQEINIELKNQ